MAVTSCRHFNGYKPCGRHSVCEDSCPSKALVSSSILLIHLGAIGAVVRATSLLKALHLKHPGCHITWLTDAPSDQLLRGHALIDRVLTTKHDDLLVLKALKFDTAYVIDKSLKAAGVLASTHAEQVFGFQADPRSGAIVPATEAATELWELGLNNDKKFFQNQKPETQLMLEALELNASAKSFEYDLPLLAGEFEVAQQRRQHWLKNRLPTRSSAASAGLVLGLNTGCSTVIPYKKLTVEFHRELIQNLLREDLRLTIVLLGGPEDTERNQQIAAGLPVISSATTAGLRDGLISVAATDVVFTGDSLGMHMAIALKKQTIAWFGPTCAHEIDLYGRGEKILSTAPCAPCWKRLCDKPVMCYDQVSMTEVLAALKRSFVQCEPTFLSKRPSSEICSSASL